MTKPMTTDELIVLLRQYPGMRVLVNGYENGYSDPEIKKEYVVPLAAPFEWQGDYASFKEGGGPVAGYFNAIIIGRNKKGFNT